MGQWVKQGVLLFFGLLWVQGVGGAEVSSPLVNYQGTLTDSKTGIPVDGTFSLHFAIYENSVGGESLWEEVQTVKVVQGSYHVLLGSVSPFSVYPGGFEFLVSEPRWLGIQLLDEKQNRPRKLLQGNFYINEKENKTCPEDMVNLGKFCMDRHQNTNGLTWYGAADFCFLQGKRLCTISEWLEACDGSPLNGVYDMPGRQSNWIDQWVYETSTEVFNAVERGFFRCSSFSRPWNQYRPLEKKWFRCCD